ncbi:SPOR domain-containing protein [Virgibacillus halodenitrificans]|uniref:SPOR domain-containing protein n=1 Tax=Virgibacillus halodenitrificans TaxID=1482 RepID=UPI0013700FDE
MSEIDKQRVITVWENGKPVKLKVKETSGKNSSQLFKKEQAAAIQEEDESVPTFARLTTNTNKNMANKIKRKYLKPVVIPIFSALIIGSVLGLIMLKMFVTLDSEPTSGGGDIPISTVEKDKEDQKAQKGSSLVQLEGVQAYVLQAGVFNEEANAVEWKEKYANKKIPTIVWEKNKQFYLFAGIAETEAQANHLSQQLQKNELEVYVKEWQTAGIETDLSNAEHQWLETFQSEWNKSLKLLSTDEKLEIKAWKKIVDAFPKDTEDLSQLNTHIVENLDKLSEDNNKQVQGILLSVWHTYEKTIKKLESK